MNMTFVIVKSNNPFAILTRKQLKVYVEGVPLGMYIRDNHVSFRELCDMALYKWACMSLIDEATTEDGGFESCAFCQEFQHEVDKDRNCCFGCPIASHTGVDMCDGTPYYGTSHQAEYEFIQKIVGWVRSDVGKEEYLSDLNERAP